MDHPRTDEPTCRHPIQGETTVHENRHELQTQWCGLPAVDWCATCNIYVCDQHAAAKHDNHSRTLAPLTEANEHFIEAEQLGERRSGDERRQS